MANLGNVLADFSFESLRLQLLTGGMFVKEQPEDLGALKTGPWTGQRPASMWQFQQHFDLLKDESVRSIAIFQSDFGAQYPKPTRLLLNLPVLSEGVFHEGLPSFDENGFYQGPLPKCTSARTTLKRTSKSAPFATSGAAAWPPGLCEWLASSSVTSFISKRATVSKGEANATGPLQVQAPPKALEVEDAIREEELEPPHPLLEIGRKFDDGGFGPPRTCASPGKTHLFHDGATLLSPGRWDKEHRNLPMEPAWHLLRHTLHDLLENDLHESGGLGKRCFQLAKCKQSPCSNECLENLAKTMSVWLVNHGCHLSVEKLMEIAPGQPFRLNLIMEMLRAANDADFSFLKEVESTGVTVGVLEPLPRTPRAFEEQTSWRLEDDPTVAALAFSANYSSVKDHQQWVRQHLSEEVTEGLMEKVLEKDLQPLFGSNVAIASLAVIHDQVSDKRRLVHDATHKVKVNHRIKCRDKLRMPGPREKFYILKRFRDLNLVPFSIIADVSKAHRRVRHKRREHGLLACKVDEADDHVFVNRVGTFGVSSAAYWWTRVFATVLRASHYLLSYEESLEVLTYADDVELIAASPAERQGATKFLAFLTAFGTPFKWEKLRGGMATDWIGFHTDYMKKELGLSTKRAEWISTWCEKLVSELNVYPAEMASGLGRLGYAANALHWEKPFLGPIYAWSSAVAKLTGKVRLPWAIALLLKWISKRLSEGGRLQPPPCLDGPPKELFRTDAKAEEGRAYIGGWETLHSKEPSKCRWFALEVTKSWAPWVWCKQNDPGRVIAALELLATIVAILVFAPDWPKGQSGTMFGTGLTDNKGNSFVLMKMLSTKFPLTILLIELSEQLRHRHLELHLQWVPREGNQEADDLTNEAFDKFSENLRVSVNPLELPFLVLPEVMKYGESLYNHIVKLKQQKRSRSTDFLGSGKKRKRDNLLDPW
jgi:hypothetical protein